MRFTYNRNDIPEHPVIAAMERYGTVQRRRKWKISKYGFSLGRSWHLRGTSK